MGRGVGPCGSSGVRSPRGEAREWAAAGGFEWPWGCGLRVRHWSAALKCSPGETHGGSPRRLALGVRPGSAALGWLGCVSSSVDFEAAAAFIQVPWPLRWIAASAAESAALAAGAKLLAVLMGGAPEEPGRAGFNTAGVQPGGSGFREGGRAGFNPARRGGSTWGAARLFHS